MSNFDIATIYELMKGTNEFKVQLDQYIAPNFHCQPKKKPKKNQHTLSLHKTFVHTTRGTTNILKLGVTSQICRTDMNLQIQLLET